MSNSAQQKKTRAWKKLNKTKQGGCFFFSKESWLPLFFLSFPFKTSDTYIFNTQNKNRCKEMKKKKTPASKVELCFNSWFDAFPYQPYHRHCKPQKHHKVAALAKLLPSLRPCTQFIRQQSVWCVHANLTVHSLHNSISMTVVRYLLSFAWEQSKSKTTEKTSVHPFARPNPWKFFPQTTPASDLRLYFAFWSGQMQETSHIIRRVAQQCYYGVMCVCVLYLACLLPSYVQYR